jgi:hypothetical protein
MRKISKAYICSECRHKVVRQIFGTENGRHETWWACSGPETHFFGVPHREKDWEYPDSAAENPNLEPWLEEEPMKGMVAAQGRDVTHDQVKTYVIEAIPATVIAAGLLAAIWISALSGATSIS